MASRKEMVLGARFEWSGRVVQVTGTGRTMTDYKGKVIRTDAIALTEVMADGSLASFSKTQAPAYLARVLKPVGAASARRDRERAISEQIRTVKALIDDPRAECDVFVARMDKGQPCAQVTFTEQGLQRLHDLLTAAADPGSALEDLFG